jgi:hypothetical protein
MTANLPYIVKCGLFHTSNIEVAPPVFRSFFFALVDAMQCGHGFIKKKSETRKNFLRPFSRFDNSHSPPANLNLSQSVVKYSAFHSYRFSGDIYECKWCFDFTASSNYAHVVAVCRVDNTCVFCFF